MSVHLPTKPITRRKHGTRGSARSVHAPAPASAPEPVQPPVATVELQRERRSGGPEDHALYRCQCGFLFQADVSTSVDCPHCGDEQAW
jgi:hypothetical protein